MIKNSQKLAGAPREDGTPIKNHWVRQNKIIALKPESCYPRIVFCFGVKLKYLTKIYLFYFYKYTNILKHIM